MAKFSFAYVKQNPVMFGAIFIVFGLLLWLMLNKGSGGGGTTVVQTGPSEQLQAAGLQAGTAVQLKQIDAQVSNNMAALQLEALSRQIEGQQSIAVLEMQRSLAEMASGERMGELQITASLTALQSQLNNNLAITEANNQFQVDYATIAAESATNMVAINAALQRELSRDQLQAYETGTRAGLIQSAMSLIPSLKKNDRDNSLNLLAAISVAKPGTTVTAPTREYGQVTPISITV